MGVHDRYRYGEDSQDDTSDERYGIFYDKATRQLTINFRWYHILAILLIIAFPIFSYRLYFGQIYQPSQKSAHLSPAPAKPSVPSQSHPIPSQSHQQNSRVISSSLFSVTIPYYDKGYRNAKFLTLEVNGLPVEFLLDTGASYVAVTPETIRRLGVRDFTRSAQAMTANGPVISYLFAAHSMKIS